MVLVLTNRRRGVSLLPLFFLLIFTLCSCQSNSYFVTGNTKPQIAPSGPDPNEPITDNPFFIEWRVQKAPKDPSGCVRVFGTGGAIQNALPGDSVTVTNTTELAAHPQRSDYEVSYDVASDGSFNYANESNQCLKGEDDDVFLLVLYRNGEEQDNMTISIFQRPFFRKLAVTSDNQTIWLLAMEQGLYRCPADMTTLTECTRWTKLKGLVANTVMDLLLDRQDRSVWVATREGLSHLTLTADGPAAITNYTTKENCSAQGTCLAHNYIVQLFQASDNSLWIATKFGQISRLEFVVGQPVFTNVTVPGQIGEVPTNVHPTIKLLLSNYMTLFAETPDHSIWIGSTEGLHRLKKSGQSYLPPESYTSAGGQLPAPVVSQLLIDGPTLWIGTWGGGIVQAQFNPAWEPTFTPYGPSQGLADGFVTQLLRRSDALWVGTTSGVSRCTCDGTPSPNITTYSTHLPTEGFLPDNTISQLVDTPYGLWIGTVWGGLSRLIFDGDGTPHAINYRTDTDDMADNVVQPITKAPDDTLWMIRWDGLRHLRYSANETHVTDVATNEGLVDNNVTRFLESRDGSVWLGTASLGLSRVKFNDDGSIHFANYLTDETLNYLSTDNGTTSILEQDDGVWLGTYNMGVKQLEFDTTGRLKNVTHYRKTDGLLSDTVTKIFPTDHGLLIGTFNGLNLLRKEADGTVHIDNFATDPAVKDILSGRPISDIIRARDGSIWIGALGALTQAAYDLLKLEPSQRANWIALLIFLHGQEWFLNYICTKGGLVHMTFDQTGVPSFQTYPNNGLLTGDRIYSLLEGGDGSLWIGTWLGLSHLTFKADGTHEFTNYTAYENALITKNISLLASYVPSPYYPLPPLAQYIRVFFESQGRLWFAASENGQGLSFIDLSNLTQIQTYTTQNGLAHNWVRAVIETHDGALWIGTWGGGISRLVLQPDGTPGFTNYTRDNLLPTNWIYDMIQKTDGLILVGTGNGLVILSQWEKRLGGGAISNTTDITNR